MLRLTGDRVAWPAPDLTNLEDLRSQLTNRLAMLLIGASGLAMWLALPQNPFSLIVFIFLAGLLSLGLGVYTLVALRPALARHLLVWGLAVALLVAMGMFADSWLPFWGAPLIFVAAMLVSGSEFIAAIGVGLAAGWLVWNESRLYALPGLWVELTLSVAVARLTVHTLYTTLYWTRNMQRRADQLLAEVRNQRVELSRTLKSSEIANSILRRTQQELITARRQAEEAQRLKEQFAANISHELRTPLNLILGFSEVMHLSPEVYGPINWPPTLRRDIYQIYRSSRHLLEMIDDILDLSRFELVGFSLHKESTPLKPLLRDTAAIGQDLFQGHTARLEVALAPDLPTLMLDRTRIRQVLLNLLNNARRFTEEGRVCLSARQTAHEVVISVSDTGPGIPADKLPFIFDEFYQVDLSLHRTHQGAGLGLAISKRFVQAHGGSIWVESQEGVGTTVSFSLPTKSSYLPMTPVEQPAWPEPRGPEGAPPRILVVDPDPAVASLVHRHLDRYEVVRVESSQALPEAVTAHHPQAVIYNVSPKETFNYDDLAAWPVPLIECSLPSQAWLADDLRVIACLAKPVTPAQLLEVIGGLEAVRDVLIIDDDRGFGQLVQRILALTRQDFQIRRTYEGEEGLSAMRQQRPDLVLLDLIMPGLGGFQVLERMRQDNTLADIPVIVLTASSFAEDALAQHGNQVVIRHLGGLKTGDVLRCLSAVVEILQPRYDERSVLAEVGAEGRTPLPVS
ncbi:MAG: response regulator [Anaerolineae bacterium]|nr:response regulator [Anaerolineae bacterium]